MASGWSLDCAAHSPGRAENAPIRIRRGCTPWLRRRRAIATSIEMSITRKQFLGSVTGGTVTLLIQACGGGGDSAFIALFGGGTNDDGTDDNPEPASTCGSSGSEITGNHGHLLTVPTTDLTSLIAVTYSIVGGATHDHALTLSPNDLAQLNSGGTVTVVSSVTDAPTFGSHLHGVTVTCV
jgi:hypothetical protein